MKIEKVLKQYAYFATSRENKLPQTKHTTHTAIIHTKECANTVLRINRIRHDKKSIHTPE